jgi:signal transduction histidine kinase
MHFDDRLATVLRNRVTGERAARTQYRQLLDLLGEPAQDRDESLEAAAFLRLETLNQDIPRADRARIVGEGGARIRNPALVSWLGEADPAIAAPGLGRASLSEQEWKAVIPALPIRARGLLRHRRDLPTGAIAILDRLGVQDRALPTPLNGAAPLAPKSQKQAPLQQTDIGPDAEPFELDEALEIESDTPEQSSAPETLAKRLFPPLAPFSIPREDQKEAERKEAERKEPEKADGQNSSETPKVEAKAPEVPTSEVPASEVPASEVPAFEVPSSEVPKALEISALVERIEAFSKARDTRSAAGEPAAKNRANRLERAPRLPLDEYTREPRHAKTVSFIFSTDTDGRIDWSEPAIAPMIVGTDLHQSDTQNQSLSRSLNGRQPIQSAPFTLAGASAIEGDWIVDATPQFARRNGRFTGYVGRFRKVAEDSLRERAIADAERIRQLLHELRTPVNAIQGFAEVIQQQLFGATPHEYRALAATIAGDSARMLSGFDELDRLVKLESRAMELEPGTSDFAAITKAQVDSLQGALTARVSRFDTHWAETPMVVALDTEECEMLAWRIFGTLGASMGAGETLKLELTHQHISDESEPNAQAGALVLSCDLPAALASAKDIFSPETRTDTSALSSGIFGAGFSLRLARAEARACNGELARFDDTLCLTLPVLPVSLLTETDTTLSPDKQAFRA